MPPQSFNDILCLVFIIRGIIFVCGLMLFAKWKKSKKSKIIKSDISKADSKKTPK
jgi:FtsZ-interacting cell division protein ZipA